MYRNQWRCDVSGPAISSSSSTCSRPLAPPLSIVCTSTKSTIMPVTVVKSTPSTNSTGYSGQSDLVRAPSVDMTPSITSSVDGQDVPDRTSVPRGPTGSSTGGRVRQLLARVPDSPYVAAFNDAPAVNGAKVDPTDPQVRKLVYTMYRGLLSRKHEDANVLLDAVPKPLVSTDEGIGDRVVAMMRQQSEAREGKPVPGGPPPPPPPPPVPTGIPGLIEMSSKGPPAALAGAMLKDKKPFTYTPGGIDLSEISSQYKPVQNGMSSGAEVANASSAQTHSTTWPRCQPTDSTDASAGRPQATTGPSRYMGSNIPSRSFKILQAMTDTSDATDGEAAGDDVPDAASPPGSVIGCSSQPSYPLPHQPPSPQPSSSSDKEAASEQSTHEHLTETYRRNVYRSITPVLLVNGNSENGKHTVSSDEKPATQGQWSLSSLRNVSPQSLSQLDATEQPSKVSSPSALRNIIREEKTLAYSDNGSTTHLYEGSKIPSRLFRQLQSEFTDPRVNEQTELIGTVACEEHDSEKSLSPKLKELLHLDSKSNSPSVDSDDTASVGSSTSSEISDVCKVGTGRIIVAKKFINKEMQELPTVYLKKPSAAPGRVFKLLQQQYDTAEGAESSDSDSWSSSNIDSQLPQNHIKSCTSVEFQNCDNDSPSSKTDYSSSSLHEPKPYNGCRLPSRTFRLLQENIETHPSVFQARK